MDGNWQQWHVPAWNVTTNGSTRRRQRYCLGIGTWKVRHKGFIDSFSLDLKAEWWLWLFFRPTMIKYGYDNIRDLVGHKIDLEKVQETPICRLDKYEQTVWYIIFVFSFPTFINNLFDFPFRFVNHYQKCFTNFPSKYCFIHSSETVFKREQKPKTFLYYTFEYSACQLSS